MLSWNSHVLNNSNQLFDKRYKSYVNRVLLFVEARCGSPWFACLSRDAKETVVVRVLERLYRVGWLGSPSLFLSPARLLAFRLRLQLFVVVHPVTVRPSSTMARGPKKHMKRLNAPKHWMLDKLGGTWVGCGLRRADGWASGERPAMLQPGEMLCSFVHASARCRHDLVASALFARSLPPHLLLSPTPL